MRDKDSSNVHFVPHYNTNDIRRLTQDLYTHFSLIWGIVKDHERQLFDMNSDLRKMSLNIEIAYTSATQLFQSEKALFLNSLQSANTSKLMYSKESEER